MLRRKILKYETVGSLAKVHQTKAMRLLVIKIRFCSVPVGFHLHDLIRTFENKLRLEGFPVLGAGPFLRVLNYLLYLFNL